MSTFRAVRSNIGVRSFQASLTSRMTNYVQSVMSGNSSFNPAVFRLASASKLDVSVNSQITDPTTSAFFFMFDVSAFDGDDAFFV